MKRFRVKDSSAPEPILSAEPVPGQPVVSLGTFLPGHYYRLTAGNEYTVTKMLAEKRIEWEEEVLERERKDKRRVHAAPSQVAGSVKVGE